MVTFLGQPIPATWAGLTEHRATAQRRAAHFRQWLVFRLETHGLFGLYRMHPDGTDRHAILPLSPF